MPIVVCLVLITINDSSSTIISVSCSFTSSLILELAESGKSNMKYMVQPISLPAYTCKFNVQSQFKGTHV